MTKKKKKKINRNPQESLNFDNALVFLQPASFKHSLTYDYYINIQRSVLGANYNKKTKRDDLLEKLSYFFHSQSGSKQTSQECLLWYPHIT